MHQFLMFIFHYLHSGNRCWGDCNIVGQTPSPYTPRPVLFRSLISLNFVFIFQKLPYESSKCKIGDFGNLLNNIHVMWENIVGEKILLPP